MVVVVVIIIIVVVVIVIIPYTYLSLAICKSSKYFVNSSCNFIISEVISTPFYKLGKVTETFGLLL